MAQANRIEGTDLNQKQVIQHVLTPNIDHLPTLVQMVKMDTHYNFEGASNTWNISTFVPQMKLEYCPFFWQWEISKE